MIENEWIVELEPDCWLALWDGSFGFTTVRENAEVYTKKTKAIAAMLNAKMVRKFNNAKVAPKEII